MTIKIIYLFHEHTVSYMRWSLCNCIAIRKPPTLYGLPNAMRAGRYFYEIIDTNLRIGQQFFKVGSQAF